MAACAPVPVPADGVFRLQEKREFLQSRVQETELPTHDGLPAAIGVACPTLPSPLISLVASYARSCFMGMPLLASEVCPPPGYNNGLRAFLCWENEQHPEVVLLYHAAAWGGAGLIVPIQEGASSLKQHEYHNRPFFNAPDVFKRGTGHFGWISPSRHTHKFFVDLLDRAFKPIGLKPLQFSSQRLAFCRYDFRTDSVLFSDFEGEKTGLQLKCLSLTSQVTHTFSLPEHPYAGGVSFAVGITSKTLLVLGAQALYQMTFDAKEITTLDRFSFIRQGACDPECTHLFVAHSPPDAGVAIACKPFAVQGEKVTGEERTFTLRCTLLSQGELPPKMCASSSTVAFLCRDKVFFWDFFTGASSVIRFNGSYSHIFLSESTLVLVNQENPKTTCFVTFKP